MARKSSNQGGASFDLDALREEMRELRAQLGYPSEGPMAKISRESRPPDKELAGLLAAEDFESALQELLSRKAKAAPAKRKVSRASGKKTARRG